MFLLLLLTTISFIFFSVNRFSSVLVFLSFGVHLLPSYLFTLLHYPLSFFLYTNLLQPLPIWGRHIKFSFSKLFSLMFRLSYSSLLLVFSITYLHLSFGLPIFQCPPTSMLHVLITSIFLFLSLHVTTHFFFDLDPIWGQRIEFSFIK